MDIKTFLKLANNTYPKAIHLLNKYWREENSRWGEPSVGFCYIGAEAAFHTIGMGFTPHVASYIENGMKCTHWWLQRNSVIIDPTEQQYRAFNEEPPYNLGRGTGFLTKQPSKKTKQFLELMGI